MQRKANVWLVASLVFAALFIVLWAGDNYYVNDYAVHHVFTWPTEVGRAGTAAKEVGWVFGGPKVCAGVLAILAAVAWLYALAAPGISDMVQSTPSNSS